jgi:hypothetical protein
MGLNPDFDAQPPTATAQPDVLINETGKMLNAVQNRLKLQLHGWSSGLMGSIDSQTDWVNRRPVFFHWERAILGRVSEDRALQECNPSTEPSVDCSDCIPPGSGKVPGRVFVFGNASASHGPSEKLNVHLPAVRPPFPMDHPQILLQTHYLDDRPLNG